MTLPLAFYFVAFVRFVVKPCCGIGVLTAAWLLAPLWLHHCWLRSPGVFIARKEQP